MKEPKRENFQTEEEWEEAYSRWRGYVVNHRRLAAQEENLRNSKDSQPR